MSNENTYRDSNCKPDEIHQNADYIHNSSTPAHCCDNDKCECHHPLRLWAIKYEVTGVAKFSGVAVVQAKDLCNAQYVFIQNSKFNGFREYIHIICIEELYPNPEPVLLLEDSAAIIDRHNLKSYPFLLKSDYDSNIQNISDNVIEAVEDYIEHNPIQQVQSNWNETDATSRAYIQNKPEIPDAQVQANWNENDTSSKAFILNKPTIPEEQVNADWNSESGKSQILNKPTDLVKTSDIEGLLRNDGTVYTGKYLEQVQDLDNFQASEGKIVQYIGATNSKYTHGYVYKKAGTQTIIPADTFYYLVNDPTQLMADIAGLRNGRYFQIEPDEISANIIMPDFCSLGNSVSGHLGYFPIKLDEQQHIITPLADVGDYVLYNGEVKQIKEVDRRAIRLAEYNYTGFRGCWVEGNIYYGIIGGFYLGRSIPQDRIRVYENEYGDRLYRLLSTTTPPYTVTYLALRKYGDKYYSLFSETGNWYNNISTGRTESETIVDTEEWQQLDVQPREDTSHYITYSDIGWIEH